MTKSTAGRELQTLNTQSGVITDDSMFRSMRIDFGEKVNGGSLDITIWEIGDAD